MLVLFFKPLLRPDNYQGEMGRRRQVM